MRNVKVNMATARSLRRYLPSLISVDQNFREWRCNQFWVIR